jgi:hypothetical protein
LSEQRKEKKKNKTKWKEAVSAPVIVPCTTDPFLSSTVTVSLFNFIKNLDRKLTVGSASHNWYEDGMRRIF